MIKQDMVEALFELDRRSGLAEVKDLDDLQGEELQRLEKEASSYMQESVDEFPDDLRKLLVERNLIKR
jgi:hypothetical protein